MNLDDYQCVPEGSICENCIYCITRLIEPLDDESWDIYIQEAEGAPFTHCRCIVLNMDLHDHIVKDCNYYTEEEVGNPFANNKFL
jgi:hypothetical protein